jgi:hypothetical protein
MISANSAQADAVGSSLGVLPPPLFPELGVWSPSFKWPPFLPVSGEGGNTGGAGASITLDEQEPCGAPPIPFVRMIGLAKNSVGKVWEAPTYQEDVSLGCWAYRWLDIYCYRELALRGGGNHLEIGQGGDLGGEGLGFHRMISLCNGIEIGKLKFSPTNNPALKLMAWERSYSARIGELFGCPEFGFWSSWEDLDATSVAAPPPATYDGCFWTAVGILYYDWFEFPLHLGIRPTVEVLAGTILGFSPGIPLDLDNEYLSPVAPGDTAGRKRR